MALKLFLIKINIYTFDDGWDFYSIINVSTALHTRAPPKLKLDITVLILIDWRTVYLAGVGWRLPIPYTI